MRLGGRSELLIGSELTPHWQSGRLPCHEAARDVRGIDESEVLQRRRAETGRIPFGAQHDDADAVISRLWDPAPRGRIQSPLQDCSIDKKRTRNLTLGRTLAFSSGIDEKRAERMLLGSL